MEDPFGRPRFGSAVYYRDPGAALDWLEKAFGFSRFMVIRDPASGGIVHAEMRHGTGYLMVGPVWADQVASPLDTDGRNTQSVHVLLDEDPDKHCERARAAGAVILREPETQFYGDRTYNARDPEGHVWAFARPVAKITRADAETASGLIIEGWWGD